MAFNKFGGTFQIIETRKVSDLNEWKEFKKQASVASAEKTSEIAKESIDKEAEFQVVANVDTEKFIYIHTTIMAGVKTASNGFYITSETEKYINDNHDSWTCDDLLSDYKSFKRATTFVEHDQTLENAKGKCIDAIARQMPDTVLIDVLFSVDKRHKDLVANIESNIINAVSMGCSTSKTICSICGNEAVDSSQYCDHVKQGNKGRMYMCADGKMRKAAEICKQNTFFDVSLVANPAFAGAVFRKILSSSELSNHLLANILTNKIESYKIDESMLKAASKSISSLSNITLNSDGTINIQTGAIGYKSAALSKEHLDTLQKHLQKEATPQIETKEATTEKSLLSRIVEKVFGSKKSNHPIINQTPYTKDFAISDENYTDITPTGDRHDVLAGQELEFELNPVVKMTSRFQRFECKKCGHTEDFWKIKAASIDNGSPKVFECPNCFFVVEASFYDTKTKKTASSKVTPPKTSANQQRVFVASQDIPVDNDFGTYWYDEQGNCAITKNERLSFITTVENGTMGLFQTQLGEDVFMPMALVNNKTSSDKKN